MLTQMMILDLQQQILNFSDGKNYNPIVIQMSKLEDNVNEILGIDKEKRGCNKRL